MSSTDDPNASGQREDPTAAPVEQPWANPGGTDPLTPPTAPLPHDPTPLPPPSVAAPAQPPEPSAAPPGPPSPQPPAGGQPPEYRTPSPQEAPAYGAPAPYGTPPAYGAPPQGAYPAPPPPTAGYPPPSYPTSGYPAAPYAPPGSGQTNGSALALTIVSAVMLVLCCGVTLVPAGIFGIVGLSQQNTDPEKSRRMARNGWIAFGVGMAVYVIVIGIWFAWGVAGGFDSQSPYDDYSPPGGWDGN